VEASEESVFARGEEPAARLVPDRRSNGFASLLGAWRGQVKIADDFDELPDDVAESLGMQS
jgi:antitoxin (DNA-binding transcriptional repressor) of toxin-antitoxin stability system